jgi:hypothetical protein
MSFAMLVGFVLGVIASFGGSAVVASYMLLAGVRDRDEIGKIGAGATIRNDE